MKKYLRCYWSHPHHPPKSLYPPLDTHGLQDKIQTPPLVTWCAPFQFWLLPVLPSQAPSAPSRLKFSDVVKFCDAHKCLCVLFPPAGPPSSSALQQSPSLPVRSRIFWCIQVFSVRTCCPYQSLFSQYYISNCVSTESLSFAWQYTVFFRFPWWLSGSACYAGDWSLIPG